MSARLTCDLETKHLTTFLLRRGAGRVLVTKSWRAPPRPPTNISSFQPLPAKTSLLNRLANAVCDPLLDLIGSRLTNELRVAKGIRVKLNL